MTTMSLHGLHTQPRQRSTLTPHGVCTAHFGELHEPLLRFITASEVVVGCVAWVTSSKILDALAQRPVALVVQKENWWKKRDARGTALARRYAALTGGLPASAFPDPLGTKSFRGKPVPNDAVMAPIACVGYGSGSQFQPLMHHKFIVRCVVGPDGRLGPTAVWTGSFNFSANANDSFENAVEIHDPVVAAGYLAEFALAASLSEPMNWRLTRPNPKGAASGAVPFAPLPAKPKATTARVVKGTAKKRARSATATPRAAQRKRPVKMTTARTPRRKAA